VAKPHTVSLRPDGKVAYVTSQDPGHFGLVVIDLAARKVVRTIPLEKTPRDAEFGYDGKYFYFTEAGVAAVQILDPKTDKIVAEIPTGVSPHFVNLFKGTPFGIVTVQGPGELLLFDPKTSKEVRRIPVGKQPHWATVSSDGKTAYVTNEGANNLSIVDIASGKTTTIDVGHAPRKIVVQKASPQHADAGSATRVATVDLDVHMAAMMVHSGDGVTASNVAAVTTSQRADAGSATKVSIAGFAFNPGTITVHPGDSVTWSNDDGSPHTVTFKDGSANSPSISPGESFTRTFDKTGSFDYSCSFHPYMTGKVAVATNS
jgi:YVTN family beta-propeller protein